MEDSELHSIMLILVKHGARKGYLLKEKTKNSEIIIALAKSMDLYVETRNDQVLVTRYKLIEEWSSSELREVEGWLYPYECKAEMNRYRISFFIDNTVAAFELCPMNIYSSDEIYAYIEETVKTWRTVFFESGLTKYVSYKLEELIGTSMRMERLEKKDVCYILTNKEEYINDLWNSQAGVGLFQVLLQGSDRIEDIELFITPLTSFYKYSVMEDRLNIPNEGEEAITQAAKKELKKELLAMNGQL